MAKAIQLEESILDALKTSAADQWLTLNTLTSLGNLIREVDSSAAPSSISELVDAILYLAEQGLLSVRQRDHGTGPVPLDQQRANDETYKNIFFSQGAFELKLTHRGRRTPDESPGEKADTDQFDDKIPTLLRAKLFQPNLENAVREASVNREPLSVLMLDIDYFKKVNDTHGHAVGDEVLRGCGELIARCVRGKGKAYRFGGEEITVLLPNFKLSEGLAVAEAIRVDVDAAVLSSMKLHVTVSVGLASFPDHSSRADELITLADKAMYQGKELGRNLVRVSGEPSEVKEVRREVKRKEPEPGKLSETQGAFIRAGYFRNGFAMCPRDATPLRIRETNSIASRTPTLIINCPICGLQEVLKGSI
jgi:diguanylate cyclase (GGDEF)-like protein